ncbi:uncharacterized protein NFIA_020310 [Aspergillus fischeri NRRL 181]|uniref:Uncharacterized protein n=1 Tax=Neosartorya fischeri (strain ATCC 1020 / DSM 3700 / CBS 544.65 / FGSC A1164 / JCM 1740 / NRRL 181 / WB 181) TaxID=331117 RepID=A1D4I0_NEOFI|nr:uncharacterized protein NFIA_020310 [Aspergillus fischeri NRRL 181]EAW23323.1 hypothetical protein NFIA_020310 [Aspergillus fischeri NRRL 181]
MGEYSHHVLRRRKSLVMMINVECCSQAHVRIVSGTVEGSSASFTLGSLRIGTVTMLSSFYNRVAFGPWIVVTRFVTGLWMTPPPP